MKSITTLLILAAAVSAHANADKHPCAAIKKACESAGFEKGKHKEGNKGLWKDCIDKIAKGESVPGVTVSAEDVSACKAKHEAHGK